VLAFKFINATLQNGVIRVAAIDLQRVAAIGLLSLLSRVMASVRHFRGFWCHVVAGFIDNLKRHRARGDNQIQPANDKHTQHSAGGRYRTILVSSLNHKDLFSPSVDSKQGIASIFGADMGITTCRGQRYLLAPFFEASQPVFVCLINATRARHTLFVVR
jgi:hypothetical protein